MGGTGSQRSLGRATPRGGASGVRSTATIYAVRPLGGATVKISGVADCLFCGIAAGEIPATRVLESPRTIAFQDINPQAPVHVLVIPKQHHENLAEVAEAGDGLLEEIAAQAALVASDSGVAETGYRVVFNTGDDGGQAVHHVHAHVLGGRPMGWPPG
jgi:histidine triad (HIT) family protein